MKAIVKLIDKI